MISILTLIEYQILIVDNDSDSQTMLKMLFEMYGVKTINASSVSEALKTLRTNLPHLIISELRLPNGDAYSLMHHIEIFELVWKVRIPAIALTIHDSATERQKALASGFSEFIPKPFELNYLILTAARVIEQERLGSLLHSQIAIS